MNILFTATGWSDYGYWLQHDTNTLKKIHKLLHDITRSPFSGLGKPEPLRFELSGYWSRRINHTDRLIYRIDGDNLIVIACKGHYE